MYQAIVITNIVFTFVLVLLGSYVHGSSLAIECTKWPICYDQAQGIASVMTSYPMIHRLFAFIVTGLNVFLLLYKGFALEERVKKIVRGGLLLLVIQSILGALSTIYNFPTIIRVAHLFLSVSYITLFSSLFYHSVKEKVEISSYKKSLKDLFGVIIFLVFAQIFFGGIVNHASATSICGIGQEASFLCNELGLLSWWPLKTSARIHMVHRYLGILIYTLSFLGIFFGFKFSSFLPEREKKYLRILFSLNFILLVLNYFAVRFILVANIVSASTAHLFLALTLLISFMAISHFFKSFEVASFGKLQPTFLRDALELMKLRLGSLVIATVVSGILLSAQFVDFFYLIGALFLTLLIVVSATTLNCYIERDVDAKMERTKDRALPSGRMAANYALWQGIVLIGVAIPLTVYFVNWSTAILGLIAFITYLFMYTPMKQKSPFALYVGAIPGAIPPVMGRTIVVGEIDMLAIILFAVLFVWQIPHFMAISIYHNDDYKAGGIKVYSHTYTELTMKVWMNALTLVLIVCSLLPFHFEIFSKNYLYAAIVLGALFQLLCLEGFFISKKEKYVGWSRRYFIASIIYLPLLMASMIFLR